MLARGLYAGTPAMHNGSVSAAKLDSESLQRALAELPKWQLSAGKLRRELVFEDFAAAFGFMTAMALVSEAMAHHPEWHNVYNRLVIELTTHDAGGLTALDLEWARAAERRLTLLAGDR